MYLFLFLKWKNSLSQKCIVSEMKYIRYSNSKNFLLRRWKFTKNTDLNRAIQEGQRLSNIQKRKKEYEEEQRRKREEEKRDALEKSAEIKQEELQKDPGPNQEPSEGHEIELEEQMHTIDFRVTGTTAQISALKQFLIDNNITYGPVPKKGE